MLGQWASGRWFQMVHGRHLVYNQCWEDPRLDRDALELGPDDELVMITSAGCNALDYLLEEPKRIHCVDVNPRQNALLELKIASLRRLDARDVFALFGKGRFPRIRQAYGDVLRQELSPAARAFWDDKLDYFEGKSWHRSFYFRGSSGRFARGVNHYIDRVARVRNEMDELLHSNSVEEQRSIYERLKSVFWNRFIRWTIRQDVTLSMLGVPRPQRQQLDRDYEGGVARFVEDSVETVFARLPIRDNYFWRVYLTGEHSADCCPEYLKPANIERLKSGLLDRLDLHTGTLLEFLENHDGQVSRFVLLDHMDWLLAHHADVLCRQWQAMLDRSTSDARFLWRSAGLKGDFVDPIEVTIRGRRRRLGDHLEYDLARARRLHAVDRVHTYGSFSIATFSPN